MTPTEQIDTKELRKLAEALGGEEWSTLTGEGEFVGMHVWAMDGDSICRTYGNLGHLPEGYDEFQVAAYIAAANPAAILALLDRLERAEAALAPFAAAYRPDGKHDAGMREFLDRNTITPSMTVGDFRRAYEAANGRAEAAAQKKNPADAESAEGGAVLGASIAQDAAAGAVPDGFKLVPVEPTITMHNAAAMQGLCGKPPVIVDGKISFELADASAVYRAMIAAAPSAPVAAQTPIEYDHFYTFAKPAGWINLLNPCQSWEEWTREQGVPTTKGWKVYGKKSAPELACASPRIDRSGAIPQERNMAMQTSVSLPPALAAIAAGRDHIQTSEFARATNRASQTLRKHYCLTGHCFGIRPVKFGNRLLWPVAEIASLLNGSAK